MVGQGRQYRSDDPSIDEGAVDHRVAPYGLPQLGRTDSFSVNSLPMFLSEYAGGPNPNELTAALRKQRTVSKSSLLLAGACGTAALATLYALMSSDAARDALAKLDASIAAIFPASVAAQLDPSQLTASNRQGNLAQLSRSENQMAGASSLKMAAAPPLRDEIKAAYQSTLSGSVSAPVVAAAGEPDATAPVEAIRHLDHAEIAASLIRANALMASGDVAAARLVLRHPADSGDGRAAMALAETYDPAILEKLGVHGIVPNVAIAREWYEKAKKFGAAEAARRLEVLASR